MNNIIPWDYNNEVEMTEKEYQFVRLIRRLRSQGKENIIHKMMNDIQEIDND